MTETGGGARTVGGRESERFLFRWECRCQQTPVLLATYDAHGRINIKARDRYWHVQGTVETVCPRCGSAHALDLAGAEGRRRTAGGSEAGFGHERKPDT
jgi:hypothetical protein